MPPGNAGEQRSSLLPPCAETVAALADQLPAGRTPFALRAVLLRDPGALFTYLSILPRDQAAEQFTLPVTGNPGTDRLWWPALERAGALGFADWSQPAAATVYEFSQRLGAVARRLATLSAMPGDPAELAGLLAPLGAMVSALHGRPDDPSHAAALTRRLAREWPLPVWLSNTLLSLDLVTPLPGTSPVDAKLAWIVQAALGLVQQEMRRRFLPAPGNSPEEALARLGLPPETLSGFASTPLPGDRSANSHPPPGPGNLAALAWRLWRQLVGSEHSPTSSLTCSFEAEQLRDRLTALQQSEHERLRDLKIRALAEFAAGAGHVINNPLAVISGQAQHLLKTEENLDRARALERIMSQCQRIHTLLRDVMLYARPPKLKPRRFSLQRVLDSVLRDLKDYAIERRVSLGSDPLTPKSAASRKRRAPSTSLRLRGDPELLRTALACLLRNAVEAAPADGWARVRLERGDNTIAIAVEDNGPGLAAPLREHLFDPFFSQRTAGRGTGLGLCKAWRVAQLHGGALEAHSDPGQPTRFVLTLPLPQSAAPTLRQAAAALRVPRRRRR